MRAKLFAASLFTLGILSGFVFTILISAAYFGGKIEAGMMLGLTIFFNIIMWLVSPWLTDMIQGWVYKIEKVEFTDFERRFPNVARFMKDTCAKHRLKIPVLRIIHDKNPTAFCYGSYPSNSRLVVSEGIFHYLNDEEASAVVGHELGHIVNKDFIVMTIAATLLQVLYELYSILIRTRSRGRDRDKGGYLKLVGLAAYVFWWAGTYLILYLSRTREYLADRFSAEATGNPNALSMALIKIAYGIAEQPDTVETRRLLASTRALGIYDFKAAEAVGGGFKALTEASSATETAPAEQKPSEKSFYAVSKLSKLFLFDLYNPWAKVAELSSTHPLTGKRIGMLNGYAREFGKAPLFDFAMIDVMGQQLDKKRLYGGFVFEVLIYFAPYLGLLAGLLLGIAVPKFGGLPVASVGAGLLGLPVLFLGIGMLIKGLYRFPKEGTSPRKTTVFELMCDAYASPLRGQFVEVEGKIIGRAEAGSTISEDMMMQDKSGGLIVLNYESLIPFIGNLFFGWRKAGKLEGQAGIATGWFRRSIGQFLDLQTFKMSSETITSYTRFWGMFGGVVVALVGFAILFASATVR